MDELTVSFQGGLADEHRLPAYAASQSLYGISRSLLVVTNYLGEGKVRHRKFDETGAYGFEINLVASRLDEIDETPWACVRSARFTGLPESGISRKAENRKARIGGNEN
jgi:hypothetical protein